MMNTTLYPSQQPRAYPIATPTARPAASSVPNRMATPNSESVLLPSDEEDAPAFLDRFLGESFSSARASRLVKLSSFSEGR
nr:hypothetical protein [uncultured Neokomagataea sp.]